MIFTLLLLVASFQVALLEEYVIPKNINIDEILSNDRLLDNYIDCLLDKASCTSEGEKLKKAIPEALQNECAKCTDEVKENIKKVIRHISEKKEGAWKKLLNKYDPNGEYQSKYEKLLKEEGIKA